jgi:hypothetical protein
MGFIIVLGLIGCWCLFILLFLLLVVLWDHRGSWSHWERSTAIVTRRWWWRRDIGDTASRRRRYASSLYIVPPNPSITILAGDIDPRWSIFDGGDGGARWQMTDNRPIGHIPYV